MVEGLALRRPAPSAATVHRQVIDIAARRGWPSPSYSTVYSIIKGIDPALLALAHGGSKRYKEMFDLVHRTEAHGPNEIWQADHSELDLWVLEDGKPLRPWLTVIEDDYSRAICGYAVNASAPSALNTALALRQAIWRKTDPGWHVHGIPDVFYTDHGSDFTSRHLEQIAADLHIRLVFSLPGQPRGRGKIERLFGTVNTMCLPTLPGYAPRGTADRAGQAALSLAQLDAELGRFFIGNYNCRVHGGTGRAPQDRWEATGFLPRIADSLEQLDLLLLTVVKTRKIRPDGIRFQGFRYVDPPLAAYVGERPSSAMTPAISPKSACSSTIATSPGPSARNWPERS
jgi:putative transposase